MADATRADALRNRARILEAAVAGFATDPDVSMNQIAKRAGVGAGTLYRNFPTREDLLLAVYAAEIDALTASVDELLADRDPLDGLRIWIRRLAEQVRIKHGLGEALASPAAQALIDATYAPVTTAIGRFLAAAAERGEVRPGIDPYDVLLLVSALWRVPEGEAGLAQADRMLELVIGSLRG